MPTLTITIEINQKGELQVSGLPPNKIAAYGIMMLATEAVQNVFKTAQEEQLIQPATMVMPGNLRG